MAQLDFYYGNQKVNEDIENWRDLEIEVNFDNDDGGHGTIKSGELIFTGDLANKINNWNAAGMGGGPGIFEAPPFRIDVCGGNTIFNGGINTAACETLYECDRIPAPLRAQQIDYLNDQASSFSWAYLADVRGIITQADYLSVPYVINSIPDYYNVIVAGLSLFTMIKELRTVVEKTVAVVSELGGDVSMVLASLVNPVIATGMAVGRVLVDIVRIILYIAYLVFIIKAIIDLIEMIFDNLIQPVKYKKGMRVATLFQKACNQLGLNFSSSILNGPEHQNDVIVPRKTALSSNKTVVQNIFGLKGLARKDYDDAKNPSSVGYPEGTFADLIVAEEARLNAQVRVIDNTLHVETEEFFARQANYTLPNIKRRNGDPHSTNACQLASNYKISYQLDDQDNNTYDDYGGTNAQMILSLRTFQNQKNILLKNITEVNLPYALAKRKETFSAVEEVVSVVYDVAKQVYDSIVNFINTIIKAIEDILKAISKIIGAGGGGAGNNAPTLPKIATMPPNPIAARKGMMLLSNDFIGVNKILVIDSSGKLHSDNAKLTSAANLMDELHFSNFAVRFADTSLKPKNDHNQWLIYTDKEIPFCCADYEAVLRNNFIKTFDQKTAKIKSIVWNPYKSLARITYWVKEQYTRNFNQSYLITA